MAREAPERVEVLARSETADNRTQQGDRDELGGHGRVLIFL